MIRSESHLQQNPPVLNRAKVTPTRILVVLIQMKVRSGTELKFLESSESNTSSNSAVRDSSESSSATESNSSIKETPVRIPVKHCKYQNPIVLNHEQH
ncbi:hypothetical protein NPIL_79251 [Nephila pilipes]|uniref:Uncharacterized protein n=1 Tax=Nephila pilipes TaxID=299642 RepID=A0A8X6P1W1_NEPPI|nr:hypothetical protein NPIL_79251 [Nephila pilipes]